MLAGEPATRTRFLCKLSDVPPGAVPRYENLIFETPPGVRDRLVRRLSRRERVREKADCRRDD